MKKRLTLTAALMSSFIAIYLTAKSQDSQAITISVPKFLPQGNTATTNYSLPSSVPQNGNFFVIPLSGGGLKLL